MREVVSSRSVRIDVISSFYFSFSFFFIRCFNHFFLETEAVYHVLNCIQCKQVSMSKLKEIYHTEKTESCNIAKFVVTGARLTKT